MIKFDEWYLPSGELHLQGWMKAKNQRVDGRLTYQYFKYSAAIKYCESRCVAIDVGAHVGLISYWMARDFEEVHSFEPVAEHRECFKKNCEQAIAIKKLTLYPFALGDHDGFVHIHTTKGSSGDSYVSGIGETPLKMLDDMSIKNVDFLKLDCEGFELFALKGGDETIQKFRPVVMVEQKPGKAQQFNLGETDAVKWLESIGYKLREHISGDFILTCP